MLAHCSRRYMYSYCRIRALNIARISPKITIRRFSAIPHPRQHKVGGQGRGKPCPYISWVSLSVVCSPGWLTLGRMGCSLQYPPLQQGSSPACLWNKTLRYRYLSHQAGSKVLPLPCLFPSPGRRCLHHPPDAAASPLSEVGIWGEASSP
jgi:hypothetical protein